MRLHIAFTVDLADLINSVERLRLAGITPRNGTDSVQIAEPVVIGWMPAASVYFDDPDGHSLELISMLPDEPRPAISHLPLSQWQKLCQVTTGARGDT